MQLTVKLTEKNYKKALKGHSFRVGIRDSDAGNFEVLTLLFNDSKVFNRVSANSKNGKSSIIKPSQATFSPVAGGSFKVISGSGSKVNRAIRKGFKNAGRALNKTVVPVLKDIAKDVAPMVTNEVVSQGGTYLTGNPVVGKIAGRAAENAVAKQVSGLGISKKVKRAFRPVSRFIRKEGSKLLNDVVLPMAKDIAVKEIMGDSSGRDDYIPEFKKKMFAHANDRFMANADYVTGSGMYMLSTGIINNPQIRLQNQMKKISGGSFKTI